MERDEALLKYQSEIAGCLEAGKQELTRQYILIKNDFERQLREHIIQICKKVKRPVTYFQISLLQCLIGQGIYRIMISVHDESYFLDSDMYVELFDVNDLFDGVQALKKKLYDAAGYYHGVIQLYSVDKLLVKMVMGFFKGICGELRHYFRDFDEWDGVRSLPESSRLVVKWGEHREHSETVFLINRQKKTQEQFISKNKENELKEWNFQYIYQGWDTTDLSGFLFRTKNFMFLNMRSCRLKDGVWEYCLIYGAAFRQTEFEHVVFSNCDLSQCNFRKTVLKNVRFIQCKLDGSDFTGAQMQEVDFTGSSMENVLFNREWISIAGLNANQLQQLRVEEEPYVFHNGGR